MDNPDLFEVYGVTKPEEPEPEEQENDQPDNAEEEKPEQSREDNARFAAARRQAKAEYEKKLADAKKQAQEELLQEQGMTNPYTKQPIRTLEEYKAYQEEHRSRTKQKFIRDAGMSESEYEEMVNGLPEVQSAKQLKAEAEQIKDENKQAEMRRWVEQEIREVSRINPNIKGADDLRNDEQYPQMLELIGKGYGISDAYKLTHFDEISAGKGRQEAINRQGKAHMGRTQARGTGNLTVPEGIMRNARLMNPKLTDEQIVQKYNRMMADLDED